MSQIAVHVWMECHFGSSLSSPTDRHAEKDNNVYTFCQIVIEIKYT